ncbi:prefoldin subunit (plasmid) [Halorarum halophilum]|uniref:Prefoldin subunit n=1 Tax=Halorarum halophilum TaxID=2743090 RepID=A0A7D5KQ00_9EURY|nr:prefoldin subunit [Halobaculum halophilum]QLG29982.1 prefoldin subunit [Halobaculum halophilum]
MTDDSQNQERDVDLSTDDEHDVDELVEELADESDESEADEFDPVEEGKEEAKRVLKEMDGDDDVERADAAIFQKQQSLQNMVQQNQAAQQNIGAFEQRLEGLEHTLARLDENEEGAVFQSLEGGVIMEVTGDTDDVAEDIADAKDRLEEQKEQLEGQLDALERGVQKNQAAIQHLQSYRDMIADE